MIKNAVCNWGDPGDRKNNHGHMTLIDKIRAWTSDYIGCKMLKSLLFHKVWAEYVMGVRP
jgi:hypothetical protein